MPRTRSGSTLNLSIQSSHVSAGGVHGKAKPPSITAWYGVVKTTPPTSVPDFAPGSPRLATGSRRWLAEALTTTVPNHPWINILDKP